MSVKFYQTVRRNNPEGGHLHIRCREDVQSRFMASLSIMAASDMPSCVAQSIAFKC
jgi:hypothetical protein